ncbi:MBL fold metallo-hydrolase [Martelella mangrovi]|uniref:Glyoxylase-like metal-dependent hydrolase (Beta-lactamase superfamily II) n=1 Tax=Martelella mangrovi TaxID=1397477 RepID=A0ABV2I7V0_9HYPH
MSLKIETYVPENAIFPIASTLIYGDREVVLVNGQFQASRARELVERIQATGRELTTIFVSHSDPDYYFALDTLRAAFPAVKIVATPQTAWLIEATKNDKLAVWKDQLGDDLPQELITPDAFTGNIEIEGEVVEVRQASDDPSHIFLWVPALKTALGGISVFTGAHPWLADTTDLAAVDQWISRLEDIAALAPEKVIGGHIIGAYSDSPEIVAFLTGYLRDWRAAAANAKSSSEIIDPMAAKYSDLPAREFLDMGAKAFVGEIPWEVAQLYPFVGHKAKADFGDFAFQLDFKDHRQMTFTDLTGAFGGISDTVNYTAVSIRPGVFMVYWSEPNSTGANVTHVQDIAQGILYTNIAGTDGSFTNLKGKLSLLD